MAVSSKVTIRQILFIAISNYIVRHPPEILKWFERLQLQKKVWKAKKQECLKVAGYPRV